jgi:DNA repair exonuclease SbcCD ATPase subunit
MLLAASLILTVPEVILLLFGAIILGITIHFFITSRRSLKATTRELEKGEKGSLVKNEWKLRYLNDMELRDKEITSLKSQLQEAEENANIYSIEAEEMRRQNSKLESEFSKLESEVTRLQKEPPPVITPVAHVPQHTHTHLDTAEYIEQLRQAQNGLLEQNNKINQLLSNIDLIKQKEEQHREILHDNAELAAQVNTMKVELSEKEREINNIREKEKLTKEMTSMLDSAYSEFSVLQSKIQKLESQLTASRMLNLEFEDLKEEHIRMKREMEEQRGKIGALAGENQHLQTQLIETEDKLREANFQRLQLQKRVTYLEELNNDFQVVSDANKKLEGQLKRIGELESMLNVVAEERDHLAKKQEDK